MPTLDDAICLLQQGRFSEGQRILEDLLKRNPSDPYILYNLGMCYSEQGMLDKSIRALERCIQLDSDNPNPYVALGFSYARNEQPEKAVEVLRRAVELEPGNYHALRNLAPTAQSTIDSELTGLIYIQAQSRALADRQRLQHGRAVSWMSEN